MRIFILLGIKNSVGNSLYYWGVAILLESKLRTLGKAYSCLEEVRLYGLYATLRMRIFILLGISGAWVVCQSTRVLRTRVFILLRVRNWEHTNLLRFQG